jgi:hypothetical protein
LRNGAERVAKWRLFFCANFAQTPKGLGDGKGNAAVLEKSCMTAWKNLDFYAFEVLFFSRVFLRFRGA